MWGDSVHAARPRRRGDGLPERQRRRQRDRLATRDPAGTRWSRPATRRSATPATGSPRSCELDGVRSVALFLESDGDGAAVRRGARARCRASDRRRGAQGRRLRGGRAAPPRRTPGRSPATSGSFAPWSRRPGAAWADEPARAARDWPARWPSRGRGRGGAGGLAVLTCSGGDSGVAADEAERLGRRAAASFGPSRPRERSGAAAARGRDDRQPARLHGDDLGRHRARCAGSWSRSAPTPRSTSCCCSTTTPTTSSPEAEDSWAGGRAAGIVAGAAEADAATLVASTLPDLIDDDGQPRARRPRRAGRRRACAPRSPARASCAVPPAIPSGCARSPPRPRAAARPDGDATWLGEAEAKELLRAAGVAVPDGPGGGRRRRRGRRRARGRLAGGAEALRPVAAAQERGRRAGARRSPTRPRCARPTRGCARSPVAAAPRSWSSA